MPKPATSAALLHLLRRQHLLGAQQVRAALGVSAPTLSRLVRSLGTQVLALGRARRRAYALRRPLRGSLAALPLYALDRNGNSTHLAQLHLAHPSGTWVEWLQDQAAFPWPLDAPDSRMRDGWFEGLPYFVQDLRPQGFMGQQFARAHADALQLSPNPRDWSDDDALTALAQWGSDGSGNFIIGAAAWERWQGQSAHVQPTPESDLGSDYLQRAHLALRAGVPGSSAAGEFPKFMALRQLGTRVNWVMVKFSGADNSPSSQRWSDLLVCESLAGRALGALAQRVPALSAASSRIVRAGARTFLEVERFDRHGLHGRSGLCSWAAINGDWCGLPGRPWSEGASALAKLGLIDHATEQAIAVLECFGRLIGNDDMHDGNLSFQADAGRLRLAPVYDMLPMLYRPLPGVELSEVEFRPARPAAKLQAVWPEAAQSALDFWQDCAADERISAAFRALCERNAEAVRQLIPA